ncbi:MAG: Ig-like domain-containing protein [Bacteroidales bacterium]|nr:Ig-like domain-containing protein [Bacteroidales bacterium]
MKNLFWYLGFLQITCIVTGQIIADHTVINRFNQIPDEYIAEVKKMLIAFPGESHSEAYRQGMVLLADINAKYSCNISTGEGYTDKYVRVEDHGWIGELEWFTWYAYPTDSRPWISSYFKNTMSTYHAEGRPFHAIGFAWCNDLTSSDHISSSIDPEYGVRWYGRSDGGPDGNECWGIEAADFSVTGNSVSLGTYFGAMEEYISHCKAHCPETKIIFTTGPVDVDFGEFSGEAGYQGHLKHEAIRNYVKADPSRILFDYADILCYDDNETQTTQTWNGHTFPLISAVNLDDESVGHIGNAGAIRLAKAQWWLLARIAGWDGGGANIPVSDINIEEKDGINSIEADKGTLQLNAIVLPEDATNNSVTWSLQNQTGQAWINQTGLVTAISDGIVIAKATANDGSGIFETFVINISGQVSVTNIMDFNDPEFFLVKTNDRITLFGNYQITDLEYFSLYTMNGRLIRFGKIIEDCLYLDVASFSPGLYIIVLLGFQSMFSLKVFLP